MRRHNSRKKNSTKVFVAFTIVAALVFGVSYHFLNSRSSDDLVVAKVGNEKIFKSEIEKKLSSIFNGQGGETAIPEVANLPKEVIDILAKEIYLDKKLVEAAKKSAVGKSKEIQGRITDLKDKILRQAYVDSLIKSKVTDEKISEKYSELSNDLTGKKEYLVSHIVVKTKEEAEKIIGELKAKKPAKFSDEAKKYSLDRDSTEKGGELGYILEDNMIKEIADAIPTLKKDQVSAPIKTKFGWHLIKISDIRDAKALPFESVKDNIREQLIQDQLNEINAEITKNATVEIVIQLVEPKADNKDQTVSEVPANTAPAPAAETPTPTTEVSLEPAPAQASENKAVEVKPAAAQEKKSQKKSDAKSKTKKEKHKKQNQ